MAHARPISMVVWALLMFLLGGLSLFASLGGFVTANQVMSNPLASLEGGSSAIAMLILLAAVLNLSGGVLGIMAGIGLLKVARWGWGVTLAYAIVLLGYDGLMLHLIFDAFGWLYPIILAFPEKTRNFWRLRLGSVNVANSTEQLYRCI
jgi:hypothetical protein